MTKFVFIALVLLWTTPARADLFADFKVNNSYAIAGNGTDSAYAGLAVVTNVGLELGRMHGVFVRVRYAAYPTMLRAGYDWGTQQNISGGFGYMVRVPSGRRTQFYAACHVGAGLWTGIVRGDSGGGAGLETGIEVGALVRLDRSIALAFGVESSWQFGMENDVGYMVQPALFVGLRFGSNAQP